MSDDLPYNPEYLPRLNRFHAKYCPSKDESHAITVLTRYKGNEENFFKSMTKKFGPEPDPNESKTEQNNLTAASTFAQFSSSPSSANLKKSKSRHDLFNEEEQRQYERLKRFYDYYKPGEKTDDFLREGVVYANGQYDKMWNHLTKKHGPEPGPDGRPSAPVAPAAAAPETSAIGPEENRNDDAQKQGSGGEQNKSAKKVPIEVPPTAVPISGSASLQSSASTVPAAYNGSYLPRLNRFHQKYIPDKTEADSVVALKRFKGREEALFELLSKKYGPEPFSADLHYNPAYLPRLVKFHEKWCPDKTEEDAIKVLKNGYGKEEELFQKLRSKFGPEPEPFDKLPAGSSSSTPPTADGGSTSTPVNSTDDYLPRLIAFHERYVPGKNEADARAALERYRGREASLFRLLRKKFGPEPAPYDKLGEEEEASLRTEKSKSASSSRRDHPTSTQNTGGDVGGADSSPDVPYNPAYLPRLVRFHDKYLPHKTETDAIHALSKMKGNEEAFFAKLVDTFGSEPRQMRAPVLLPSKTAANEHQQDPTVARLIRYNKKYFPTKTEADAMKTFNQIGPERADELFKKLESKYGPEPPYVPPSSSSKGVGDGDLYDESNPLSYFQRLRRFNAHYVPVKAHDSKFVRDVLSTFEGREERLFARLIQKYGPEPAYHPEPEPDSDDGPKTNLDNIINGYIDKYNTQLRRQQRLFAGTPSFSRTGLSSSANNRIGRAGPIGNNYDNNNQNQTTTMLTMDQADNMKNFFSIYGDDDDNGNYYRDNNFFNDYNLEEEEDAAYLDIIFGDDGSRFQDFYGMFSPIGMVLSAKKKAKTNQNNNKKTSIPLSSRSSQQQQQQQQYQHNNHVGSYSSSSNGAAADMYQRGGFRLSSSSLASGSVGVGGGGGSSMLLSDFTNAHKNNKNSNNSGGVKKYMYNDNLVTDYNRTQRNGYFGSGSSSGGDGAAGASSWFGGPRAGSFGGSSLPTKFLGSGGSGGGGGGLMITNNQHSNSNNHNPLMMLDDNANRMRLNSHRGGGAGSGGSSYKQQQQRHQQPLGHHRMGSRNSSSSLDSLDDYFVDDEGDMMALMIQQKKQTNRTVQQQQQHFPSFNKSTVHGMGRW